MKEYCIYVRNGGGMPYILNTYNDLNSAKIKLYDMISLEIERNRPYFVDNDFYDNKYNISTKLKYFCIMQREITEWEKYSLEKTEIKNNIIYFNNFKK